MRITSILLMLLLLTISLALWAQNSTDDAIIGTWLTADKTGEITIFKDENKYFGKITAGTSDQKFDVHNPDKARRRDPLIGMVILRDLKYDADDKIWENGSVYDPHNGKRYSCNVRLASHNTLKITGYIGFSWIGRSEQWTRLK